MGQIVRVWGNGKVDERGVAPDLVSRLQTFVDTQRKSAIGTHCLILIHDIYPLIAYLYEQSAGIIEDDGADVMSHTLGFPATDKAGDAS